MGTDAPTCQRQPKSDPLPAVGSSGDRNEGGLVDLAGSLPSQGLAWPVVELVDDGLDVVTGVERQIGLLWEVLAEEPVGRSYVCQAAGLAACSRAAASMTR
jgi:hypothetical protein